jgi:hypothetical protein
MMPLTAATHLTNGLAPTGPMPTLTARMIAFQSTGNPIHVGQKEIKLRMTACASRQRGCHTASIDFMPARSASIIDVSLDVNLDVNLDANLAIPICRQIALEKILPE